jgi:hypothetical protein
MPIAPSRRAATVLSASNNFIGRLLVGAIFVRLVQARENRKCEYQNRYYDPEYFVHKSRGAPTQPADWIQLHALFIRIYAAYHLLIRKRRDRVLENVKFIRGRRHREFHLKPS